MRRRLYIILTLGVLLILALAACQSEPEVAATPVPLEPTAEEETVDLDPVTIGLNAEYPPFEFVNDDGEITGFDAELIDAIAAEAGFDYELVNTRWDGIFVALASGEFDAVISAATITPEREETVNFSDPYFDAGQVITVRAGETEIAGPEDLDDVRVGVQLGTTGDIWLTEETNAEVVRFDENTLAFQALANSDVDAAVADSPTAAEIVRANPEMNLELLDGVYTDEQYGIAVNMERDDLLQAINQGLAAVKASGEYDEIYDKYFGVGGGETVDLGPVTIGLNAEYPPFEFVNDDGEITGFDAELIDAIAAEAGFDYELVNTRWDGIFVALASGEFDAVISAATITPEREETVNFSDPYFDAGQVITVRAGETEIAGPEDLDDVRVGVQLGTTGDIWLTEETNAEVVRFDENTLAFQALANSDVDAAVADSPTAAEIVRANPEMNLELLDGVYTDEQYGIAVNMERDDLLQAINQGLAAVKASGEYNEIYDTYFGTD